MPTKLMRPDTNSRTACVLPTKRSSCSAVRLFGSHPESASSESIASIVDMTSGRYSLPQTPRILSQIFEFPKAKVSLRVSRLCVINPSTRSKYFKFRHILRRISGFSPSIFKMRAPDQRPWRTVSIVSRNVALPGSHPRGCHQNNVTWIIGNLFALAFSEDPLMCWSSANFQQ
jgi:hypothetical protein